MARKHATDKRTVLAGLTACVYVERNGASVRIENVPAEQSAEVLCALLVGFRSLAKSYGELIPGPDTIPSGHAVDVVDDGDFGDRRRAGFR